MKRFHVHVAVPDLAASVRFYSTMFAAQPSVLKDDYAKWMLDDPRVNFAISQRGATTGINHLGFQVDSGEELEALHEQLAGASRNIVAESNASCCYAKSDKYWVTDPAGIAWESFHSLGTIPLFGADADEADEAGHAAGAALDSAVPAEVPTGGCGCGTRAEPPKAALPATRVSPCCK